MKGADFKFDTEDRERMERSLSQFREGFNATNCTLQELREIRLAVSVAESSAIADFCATASGSLDHVQAEMNLRYQRRRKGHLHLEILSMEPTPEVHQDSFRGRGVEQGELVL